MRNRTVYVAGPMTDIHMFNWPMFFRASRGLRGMGWTVVNPAEQDLIDGVNPFEQMSGKGYATVLKEDFRVIIAECDAIALLPGWKSSVGARAECLLSQLIGNDAFEIVWGGVGNDPLTLHPLRPSIIETRVASDILAEEVTS